MNSTSKSLAKKASKPSRKQRKAANANSRATAAGAPAAVSNDIRQYTRFSGSSQGLVMHTCCAISEVLSASGGATGTALLNGGNGFSAIQLNLTSPYGRNSASSAAAPFTSPVWDLIGSAFTRYRIRKLKFHYEPQSSSTAAGRLVFAFARDPDHPLLWTSTASSANNLAVADSIAFMPWRSWSMDVSEKLDNTLYYTYDFNESATSATDRFSNFGVISCITSLFGTTQAIAGVLYMETEIELVEFCPISVTRPALAGLGEKLRWSGVRKDDSDYGVPDEKATKKDIGKEAMLSKLAETYQFITSQP